MDKLSGGDDNFTTQYLGWNMASDPCQSTQSNWRGANCDDNQSVSSIILSGLEFSGTLDPELICPSVKSLNVMWLPNNTISGPIPESIANCTSLVILDLYNNSLSGSIPDSIVRLSNLTGLVISYNNVSGEIPQGLAKVLHLTYFLAESNSLTGSIPDFDTQVMERLNVSNNNLSGAIPDGLGEKFGANRFMGNPGLCGKPLSNSCTMSGPEPAPNQQKNDSYKMSQKKWVELVLTWIFSFLFFELY
ncbi:Probable leucine-rich repeat receptor-like protein kinase At1g68400 [Linum perenne]